MMGGVSSSRATATPMQKGTQKGAAPSAAAAPAAKSTPTPPTGGKKQIMSGKAATSAAPTPSPSAVATAAPLVSSNPPSSSTRNVVATNSNLPVAVASQTRMCIEQLQLERASLQQNFGNHTKQTLAQQKRLVESVFNEQLQQLEELYAAEEHKLQSRLQHELSLLASQKELRKKEVKEATLQELAKLDIEGQRLLDFAVTTAANPIDMPNVGAQVASFGYAATPAPFYSSMPHLASAAPQMSTQISPQMSDNPKEFQRDTFFEEWLCNAFKCSREQVTSMTIAECVDKLVQQRISYPSSADFWRRVSVTFQGRFAEELDSWRDASRT